MAPKQQQGSAPIGPKHSGPMDQASIDKIIAAALSKSMFSQGVSIPLANEENQRLQKLLEEKQQRLLQLNKEHQDDITHTTNLSNHFSRTQYTFLAQQNLLAAKAAQISAEQDAMLQTKKILAKDKRQAQVTLKELREICEHNAELLAQSSKRKASVDQQIARWQFDLQRIEELKQLTRSRFEDMESLQQYCEMDDQQMQVLKAREAGVVEEHRTLTAQLDDEYCTTLRYQDFLSRVMSDFRHAHGQRSETIQAWEDALRLVKVRDQQISSIAQEYAELRAALQPLEEHIRQEKREQEMAVSSTKEAFFELDSLDKKINQFRQLSLAFQDQIRSLDSDISLARGDCRELQRRIIQAQHALEEAERELLRVNGTTWELEPALRLLKSDLEERLRGWDDAEKDVENSQRLITNLEEECYKLTEKTMDFDRMKREVVAEKQMVVAEAYTLANYIQARNSSVEKFYAEKRKHENLERELNKKISFLTMRCAELEVRIRQMTENTAPRHVDKADRVQPLRKTLNALVEDNRLVARQVEANKSRLLVLDRHLLKEGKVYEDLQLDMKYIEGILWRLEKDTERIQDEHRRNIVELSLEKLVAKRLLAKLNQERENVCEQAAARLEMEAAVKERQAEIETAAVLYKGVLKTGRESIHRLKTFINEVQASITCKKLKYDNIVLVVQISTGGLEDGQAGTLTEALLQFVKEIEILRRLHEEWKIKLETSEKELEGLRNAALLVSASNQAFKQTLAPLPLNAPELQEQERELAETNELFTRKHQTKRQQRRLFYQCQQLSESLEVLFEDVAMYKDLYLEKEEGVSILIDDIQKQRKALCTLACASSKQLLTIKDRLSRRMLEMLEMDLKATFLHVKLQFALVMAVKLMQDEPASKKKILSSINDEYLQFKLQYMLRHGFISLRRRKRFEFLQELYPQFLEYVTKDKQWQKTIGTTRPPSYETVMKRVKQLVVSASNTAILPLIGR